MKWIPELGLYAAAIRVSLPKTGEVTLVFCQAERKTKFALFLSTDLDLETVEILKTYAKRWSIEMFFKDAKQHLGLGQEQNRDFDALIAHHSFVLIRYQLLSCILTLSTHREPLGPLFESISDEVVQSTVMARLWEFFKYLIALSSQILFDNQEKQTISKLIDYLNNIVSPYPQSLSIEGANL